MPWLYSGEAMSRPSHCRIFARQAATAIQNVQLVEALRTSEERLRSLVTSLTETLYSVRVARGAVIPTYYSPQIEGLTGRARRKAWADLDVEMMRDDPPWAPIMTKAASVFVSKSFGCFVFQPVYARPDLAAACKK